MGKDEIKITCIKCNNEISSKLFIYCDDCWSKILKDCNKLWLDILEAGLYPSVKQNKDKLCKDFKEYKRKIMKKEQGKTNDMYALWEKR